MMYTIRWRLVASYVLLTLLTVTMMGFLGLSLVRQQARERELDYLTANANAVAKQAEQVLQSAQGRQGLLQLVQTSAFLTNARVRILDADGNLLADSGPRAEVENLVAISPPRDPWPDVRPETRLFGTILMTLPDANWRRRLSPANLDWTFLQEQLPPGAEYLLVQRISDPLGSRVTFQVEMRQELLNLLSETGAILEETPATPQPAQPQQPDAQKAFADQAGGGAIAHAIIGDAANPLGLVEVSSAIGLGKESLASTSRAFLLAGLSAALIALVAGLAVSRQLAAPISRLTAVAGEMSGGNLSVRAPQGGRDEIGQLARQFNQMAERLEASFTELAMERDALRRFIADASHELRTPITALKSFIDLLQGPAANDPVAQAEFLAESQAQIGRLEWITANLLDLSRLEAGLVTLELSRHNADELLEEAAAPFHLAATGKGIDLIVRPPEQSLMLICDRPRLELALSNLLDNALKFTPQGGRVEIGARPAGDFIEIWVQDEGPGIDPSEQSHIFERFYRGRHSEETGSGLGLAIVKGIVQAHGGEAEVQSMIGQGTTILLRLPAR